MPFLSIRPQSLQSHKSNRDKITTRIADIFTEIHKFQSPSHPFYAILHVCPFQKLWEVGFGEKEVTTDTAELEPGMSHAQGHSGINQNNNECNPLLGKYILSWNARQIMYPSKKKDWEQVNNTKNARKTHHKWSHRCRETLVSLASPESQRVVQSTFGVVTMCWRVSVLWAHGMPPPILFLCQPCLHQSGSNMQWGEWGPGKTAPTPPVSLGWLPESQEVATMASGLASVSFTKAKIKMQNHYANSSNWLNEKPTVKPTFSQLQLQCQISKWRWIWTWDQPTPYFTSHFIYKHYLYCCSLSSWPPFFLQRSHWVPLIILLGQRRERE